MNDEQLKRRFTKVRVGLMRSPMFIEMAPIMMLGKKHIVDDMPTAATDGRNEWYGKSFIEKLEDEELGYVVMHENFHKMGRHLTIYKKLSEWNHARANAACDYWINGKLNKIDPSGTLIRMPKITQEMWDELPKKTQAKLTKEKRGVGSAFGLVDPTYDGMNIKQIWDILSREDDEKEEPGDGDGDGDGDGGFDNHDWGAANGMTEQEIKEHARDIDDAIRQGIAAAKKAGNGAGNHALGLQELLKPKINWREQLQEFIRSSCSAKEQSTWRRPNRRRYFHDGIMLPTMQGQTLHELVLAIDASGSMLGKPLQAVMSEVKGVAEQLSINKVHVLYWDGEVEKHEEYDRVSFKNWENTTSPTGGGGTTPSCVAKYLQEKRITPDAVVVLTDGEVSGWGEWSHPVLWAIYNPRNAIVSPVGKTINIEED